MKAQNHKSRFSSYEAFPHAKSIWSPASLKSGENPYYGIVLLATDCAVIKTRRTSLESFHRRVLSQTAAVAICGAPTDGLIALSSMASSVYFLKYKITSLAREKNRLAARSLAKIIFFLEVQDRLVEEQQIRQKSLLTLSTDVPLVATNNFLQTLWLNLIVRRSGNTLNDSARPSLAHAFLFYVQPKKCSDQRNELLMRLLRAKIFFERCQPGTAQGWW